MYSFVFEHPGICCSACTDETLRPRSIPSNTEVTVDVARLLDVVLRIWNDVLSGGDGDDSDL